MLDFAAKKLARSIFLAIFSMTEYKYGSLL